MSDKYHIPCSLSLRLLESNRVSLGTYGLIQKLCLKKQHKTVIFHGFFWSETFSIPVAGPVFV